MMKARLSDNFCVIRFILIHKGYQFFIVSLAQKQALKNFTANNHLELTRRPLSKLAETRGSTPSLI